MGRRPDVHLGPEDKCRADPSMQFCLERNTVLKICPDSRQLKIVLLIENLSREFLMCPMSTFTCALYIQKIANILSNLLLFASGRVASDYVATSVEDILQKEKLMGRRPYSGLTCTWVQRTKPAQTPVCNFVLKGIPS